MSTTPEGPPRLLRVERFLVPERVAPDDEVVAQPRPQQRVQVQLWSDGTVRHRPSGMVMSRKIFFGVNHGGIVRWLAEWTAEQPDAPRRSSTPPSAPTPRRRPMASDPREAVLLEWKWDLESMEPFDADSPDKVLRALDAADPLRAMLGGVVEALEGLRHRTAGFAVGSWEAGLYVTISNLESRLRTLTPTEGGVDDDE